MLLTLLLTAALAATPAPRFDAVQMMKLKRLADPQVSPDGKWLADNPQLDPVHPPADPPPGPVPPDPNEDAAAAATPARFARVTKR